MFLQRLISALILVPLVLAGLWYGSIFGIGLVILVLLMLAGIECWQLIPTTRLITKALFLALLSAAVVACGQWYDMWLPAGLVLWGFIALGVLFFPQSQRFWGYDVVVAGVCLVTLPLFVQSLMHLVVLPQGKALLIYLLFLIWAADVGAYLAGKQWGTHKMIPEVSPGKSWEGLCGGLALSMVIATIGSYYLAHHLAWAWYGLALATVGISVFGDLFISVLKRRTHLKDTGALIPGHGGILDRIDSLIAAAPLFYFGLMAVNMS